MTATACAVVLLAACSSGESTESGPPETTDTGADVVSGTGFDPTRQGPAADVEGATEGGIVTILTQIKDNVEPLDPSEAYQSVPLLSSLVFRSLTQYVYDPEQDAMVVVPDIATDIGTANDDFTEWEYTIREGVRFEDGTEVTAEDVAYGIMRSFDDDAFPNGPHYSNEFFLDGDTYKGPYKTGNQYDGIEIDGNTLTLKMARPFPAMPYWATWPAMGPIPQAGSLPAEYKLHPLATGPYKFGEYKPGESLTLVRNDQWDPDTDPGRHQYVDEFHLEYPTPVEQIESALLADSGEAQTTLGWDSLLPSTLLTAQSDAPDRLVTGPSLCMRSLSPDYRKIDNISVRRAIGYAHPYEDVWRANGAIPGVTALAATSVLPPGFPGRVDYNPLSTEPGQTDPAKSRELLREAGYAPGEYRLYIASYKDDVFYPAEAIVELAEGLERGGFKVTVYPQDSLYDKNPMLFDPSSPVNLRQGGWCPDWPSGSSWFPQVFSSSDSDIGTNRALFHEEAVDDQIEAISLLPLEEQPAAWGALDKQIMTKYYPLVVTQYLGRVMLHGSRVGGVSYDSVNAKPYLKNLYVIQ